MRTRIYYFSGTGNSLNVAKDLAKRIEGSELVPIAGSLQGDTIVAGADRLGFVHPQYFYGLPGVVREFVKRIDLTGSGYLFSVATCMYPAGMCLEQMESLLSEKGRQLDGGFYVKMPNNYLIGKYEVSSQEAWQKLFQRAEEKVQYIADVVLDGKKHRDATGLFNFLFKRFLRAPYEYETWLKNVRTDDSHFIVGETCASCGTCEMVCPVNNIQLQDGHPQWQHGCEQCLACIHFCPNRAIQYGDETLGKARYRHPDIKVKEIIAQKELVG